MHQIRRRPALRSERPLIAFSAITCSTAPCATTTTETAPFTTRKDCWASNISRFHIIPSPYEEDHSNPFYRYDPQQCILCGRCVEACQNVQVNETLSINWEDPHPRVLNKDEAERVLSQPKIEVPLGIRDRAMLELLYSSGLRRMELLHLKLYDVDQKHGLVTVRQGKGKRDRVVPVGERALAWLDLYLNGLRPEIVRKPDTYDCVNSDLASSSHSSTCALRALASMREGTCSSR